MAKGVSNANKLNVCHLQFIVDNYASLSDEKIARKLNGELSKQTVRNIRYELGLKLRKSSGKRPPGGKSTVEVIAEKCSFDIQATAEMLERGGYVNVHMREVMRACGVEPSLCNS